MRTTAKRILTPTRPRPKSPSSYKAVPVKARVLNIFCRWQGSNVHKTECYRLFKIAKTKEELRRALKRTRLPGTVRRAVEEALLQTDA